MEGNCKKLVSKKCKRKKFGTKTTHWPHTMHLKQNPCGFNQNHVQIMCWAPNFMIPLGQNTSPNLSNKL